MPRLLLVDDNPSIHRIAESLLAPTDVELVCVDSAAEALDRLAQGERFDVALVDTAMPGMDGWTLLARLRSLEETARMPIALMAGVLDPVDPAKLAKAPVQGFLKKPIELRELGDRVKALLATPVTPAPAESPFSTVPATPAQDLLERAERHHPEFREEAPAPEPVPAPVEASPFEALDLPEPAADDADVLVLTAEDLWAEEAPPAAEAPAPDVRLELEELDLESLQSLTAEPHGDMPPIHSLQMPPLDEDPLADLAALSMLDVAMPALPEPAPLAAAIPEPEPQAAPLPEPEPASEPTLTLPAAAGQAPAVPGQPLAELAPGQAQALIQALLADPVLVDALVKAVVARMGDQVLREIAWEVMPELAGKLQK